MNIKATNKLGWLGQALFVVFLWSAAKVVMKVGLLDIPPYFLAAAIQVVSLVGLLLQAAFQHAKLRFTPRPDEIFIMITNGVVAYAAANLFVSIGLQYVTGATAGLVAATNSIFVLLLAAMILRERPKWMQYVGIGLVLLGAYVFVANQVIGGSLIGIGLLLVAEMAFAFSNVMTRLIAVGRTESVALSMSLISSMVGVAILVPTALLVDGWPQVEWSWQIWTIIGVVGMIFSFAGVMWGHVLDRLRVLEVSILANTMIIQVAILSAIFLRETITSANIAGGLLVVSGALVVDGVVLWPKRAKA